MQTFNESIELEARLDVAASTATTQDNVGIKVSAELTRLLTASVLRDLDFGKNLWHCASVGTVWRHFPGYWYIFPTSVNPTFQETSLPPCHRPYADRPS
jgi:hypothetical protein